MGGMEEGQTEPGTYGTYVGLRGLRGTTGLPRPGLAGFFPKSVIRNQQRRSPVDQRGGPLPGRHFHHRNQCGAVCAAQGVSPCGRGLHPGRSVQRHERAAGDFAHWYGDRRGRGRSVQQCPVLHVARRCILRPVTGWETCGGRGGIRTWITSPPQSCCTSCCTSISLAHLSRASRCTRCCRTHLSRCHYDRRKADPRVRR